LRDRGKTAVIVHHDLATVTDYFDHVLLLNGEVIGSGPAKDTMTVENLQRAYGGRLAFLEGASGAAFRR
jgi:manganese/zinc/iron transport system ATP- binding protein